MENSVFLTPVKTVPTVNDMVIMGSSPSTISPSQVSFPSQLPLPSTGNNNIPQHNNGSNILEQLTKVAESDPEKFTDMVQRVQAMLDIKKHKDLIQQMLNTGNYILDPLKKELIVVLEHNHEFVKYVVIAQAEVDFYYKSNSSSRSVIEPHLVFEQTLLTLYNSVIMHVMQPIESLAQNLQYPSFNTNTEYLEESIEEDSVDV